VKLEKSDRDTAAERVRCPFVLLTAIVSKRSVGGGMSPAFFRFTTTCPSMNYMLARSFSISKVTDNTSTDELPKRCKPEV
jgi:hypothetical protein